MADLILIEADPGAARAVLDRVPLWFHTFSLDHSDELYTPGVARDPMGLLKVLRRRLSAGGRVLLETYGSVDRTLEASAAIHVCEAGEVYARDDYVIQVDLRSVCGPEGPFQKCWTAGASTGRVSEAELGQRPDAGGEPAEVVAQRVPQRR